MSLAHRWNAARTGLGLGPDDATLADLTARYREPHRRYHGLSHLEACLMIFEEVRALATPPVVASEVVMALFFHDAIYVPFARDNEAESATLATEVLARAGLDQEASARIEEAILATRHAEENLSATAALVVDVDLSILATPAPVFDAYEDAVRAEYAALDDARFAEGRAAFVRSMLARAWLYSTPGLRERWEADARANLRRSLTRWR